MKSRETLNELQSRVMPEIFAELTPRQRTELRAVIRAFATEYRIRGFFLGVIVAGVVLWLIDLIRGHS